MAGSFLTDDLNTFFDSNDFAESAIHTPQGGSAQTAVNVQKFENRLQGDQYGSTSVVNVEDVEVLGKTTDLEGWNINDTVSIGGVTYKIGSQPTPDETGVSKVDLHRTVTIKI